MRFRDRGHAGRQLVAALSELRLEDPVVLGLPRGGIPVAAEISAALGAPLDVFVARKIGAPGHEELGIGAVAEGSDHVVVTGTAARLGIDSAGMQRLADVARHELDRRVQAYRQGRELPPLKDRDVVLVDDGLATGVTAEAALRALRIQAPRRIVLAVPVCAQDTRARLMPLADEVVCVLAPLDFSAVGAWYDDFSQTTDDEVMRLLAKGRSHAGPTS